ncbi:MAG: PilN domain-containing protein [Candidatus Omnitrophota bacterium]|jgi:Tfp pilus assembly protein PilN
MIEINLLPEELRNRVVKPVKPVKSGAVREGAKPGLQQLILLIPFIFVVLVIAHIAIVFLGVTRYSELSVLKGKWERLLPERKALEDFNNEHTLYSGDSKDIQKLVDERINWAEKLNRLSLILPPGIWFESISVSGKAFNLHGKVVSLDKEEVALLRNFIDDLKNKPDFAKNFNTLDLNSIQKETIGGYEVADFTLTGVLK